MSVHFAVEEGALRAVLPPFVEHASRRLLLQVDLFVRALTRAQVPVPYSTIADALRPFIHTQNPATFLAASAKLGATGRSLMMDAALDTQRQRLLREALQRVERTASAGAQLRGALAQGTRDKKAYARIHALACLVGAYEELEARAQLERDTLRKKLGIAGR
jgi:hypothetical protein